MWEGIKGFGKKAWSDAKRVIGKVGEIAGKVVSPIAKVISFLPGKIGLIGKGVAAGTEVLKGIANQIPNEQAREKVTGFIDKSSDGANRVIDKGKQIADKGAQWGQFVGNVADKIHDSTSILRPQVM